MSKVEQLHWPPSSRLFNSTEQNLGIVVRAVSYNEGDGIGRDIWAATSRVLDAAVKKAYRGKRQIHWLEFQAGQKAFDRSGNWLPDETLDACREYLVALKGPLPADFVKRLTLINMLIRYSRRT